MDLLHLQYFQTVARLEHMTNAANELHVAQPALSLTIARLEKEIGVPLFDRNGRQIRLNAYGKAYLEKVNIALTALDEGKREALDMAGMERGSISLVVTTLSKFSELLEPFVSIHPHVRFHITQTSTEEVKLQQIKSGEVDFCFTTSTPDMEAVLGGLPLLNEEILLAVPSQHRLSGRNSIHLDEVAHESFISLKAGNSLRELSDSFCRQAGFNPNIVCESDEPSTIGSLVRTGLGVAFLPASAKYDNSSLQLLHIEEPVCEWTLQMVWLKKRYLSKAARTFRDYVVEHYTKAQAR
ncbi:LysR family transcriptional regulator [Cohnella sp. WQ 127256]|uniref:LysR family transcriptional regulator n=1 Tax=Cohnella sp. WQ 127256 TaxID=2938790 RepID=UPI002117F188|nr:LysR family transcriptional regulator [Cohnella sp. WQ 127256]